MGYTYTWTYDKAGNILCKRTHDFTTEVLDVELDTVNYVYGNSVWGDLLTSYGEYPIEYDGIGNPTKIVTSASTGLDGYWDEYGYEYEWQGRQLMSRSYYERYSDGSDFYDDYYAMTFSYNADGICTGKTIYDVEYTYILDGTQIIGETWTDGVLGYTLLYVYDENGSPIGLKYRTDIYAEGYFDSFFFEKNLHGDIIAIYNVDGDKIGSYIYDAWGNFSVTTVSGNTTLENQIVNSYNPFRYRGYYYDVHLGW